MARRSNPALKQFEKGKWEGEGRKGKERETGEEESWQGGNLSKEGHSVTQRTQHSYRLVLRFFLGVYITCYRTAPRHDPQRHGWSRHHGAREGEQPHRSLGGWHHDHSSHGPHHYRH